MNLGLDYDGTYTLDPEFWNEVISLANKSGHRIAIVTKRGPSNQGPIQHNVECPVIYCDRAAKLLYCRDHLGIQIDVWIDDSPQNLYEAG